MKEDLAHQLLNGSPEAILLMDRSGRIRGWNMRALSLFAWKDTREGKTSVEHLLAPNERLRVLKAIDFVCARAESSPAAGRLEATARRSDGKQFLAELRLVPIQSDDQPLVGAYIRNVTENRLNESSHRQARKMEALGRLAGGVSHDFNNLLTAILGYSSLLAQGLEEDHPMKECVDEIIQSGSRAAKLTRQLLAFSRKQMLTPKVLEMNRVVREMEKMLRRVIGEHVQFETVLDAGSGTVRVDPSQLEQVIMNLVVNARDAMPEGGVLTVQTGEVELGEEEAERHAEAKAGPYILLAVSDTGTGIDDETRTHLFEPFFTTKGKNRGTGLGLSTVYGIVKQSGGFIRVKSEQGQGTTFEVLLPAAGVPAEDASSASLSATRNLKGGTILIAEDSETVRALAARILRAKGFTVLEAINGFQAVQMSKEHSKKRIDLLITDVVMPGMNGPELAERLRTQRPRIRVLYMSGYPGDNFGGMEGLGPNPVFLQKPFTPRSLTSKAYEALDAPQVAAPTVL